MDQELKDLILKTGTTTLGIVCKDGIVMASDRQITSGHMKEKFDKTVKINDYSLLSYAGNASDAQRLAKILSAELKLIELRSKTRPRIKKVANLLSSISYSSIRQPTMIPSIVASLIGGIDEDNNFGLYSISPDGTLIPAEDFLSNGSGSVFVVGLLERQYKKNINVEEGIELAKEALKSSTQRDIYSGLGIDIFSITKDGIKKEVEQEIVPEYKDSK